MLEACRDKYGDPFFFHSLNGPTVVTGREDLIREIYGANPDNYLPFATETIIPLLGEGSLFAMMGSDHRRERKLLMPMFHGDRMRAYGENMCRLAYRVAEDAVKIGRLQTLPLMTDVSFAVIAENIIGNSSLEEQSALVQRCKTMIQRLSPLLFFTRRTHFSLLGLSPWDRFVKAKTDLYSHIDRIIDERQRSSDSHDDILSLLCNAQYEDGTPMTRPHIRDELITFLFAGHETTALSLTWAMYHLHRNPETLAILRQELDSLDGSATAFAAAPYLKACVQETLRIHPIVTETLRKLKEPMSLGEFQIPAGYAVVPATVLAHYNPDIYPNPDQFNPERFLDKSYSPFVYMPFGGGHRRCIGAAFATYEMMMVLGTMLKHFDFQQIEAKDVVPKRRNVTMGPSSEVPLIIRKR